MKSSKLQRLARAIAAAGLLFGSGTPAVSTEISATEFVTNLQRYVEDGEIAAARNALQQLQAMGINQIKIGDEYFGIVDVLTMMDNPSRARMLLATWLASVTSGVKVYFVSENRVVASINWAPLDNDIFPTGSTGV